jgi:SAM-dependent methyltransferase
MSSKMPKCEKKAYRQIEEHYKIEKELANKLRNSTKEQRRRLYGSVYDELYERVPFHPQLIRKVDARATAVAVARQMRLLKKYLRPKSTFLELGPGDCSLSFEVAKYVKHVYAADVSAEITRHLVHPENFTLIISDGCSVPVPEGSIDIAYSNQLMEHLHPDDAFEQLQNIYKALARGGIYICVTPNRLSGPHDISMYFDKVATGFHLKEYTFNELDSLLRKVGFSKVQACIGGRGIYLKCPLFLIRYCEKIVNLLPFSLMSKISNILPFKVVLAMIVIIGLK